MKFGKGIDEVIYVFSYGVCFLATIANDGAADRNNRRDRPHSRGLVDLGQQVKEVGSGLIRTVQVFFLFGCDVFMFV